MTDTVYVCKDGENPELRYSLRTLKNVNHDRVWIFGGAPVWIDTDKVLFRPRSQGGSAYRATRSHIAAACNTSEVSDPFYLWNDDFFAMKEVGDIPIMHRGPLSAMLEEFADSKTPWAKGLRETAELLSTIEGVVDPVSYDTHLPLLVYKAQMREALRMAEKIRSDAVHLRTIYGNIDPIGGTAEVDPKMIRRTHPFPPGPWLSSSDDSFRYAVEPVLRYLFPDPSPYEKVDNNG